LALLERAQTGAEGLTRAQGYWSEFVRKFLIFAPLGWLLTPDCAVAIFLRQWGNAPVAVQAEIANEKLEPAQKCRLVSAPN
jgi:hypothetical protein